MKLSTYLNEPTALSVAQLRILIGAKSDAQIRQWQHSYAGRFPSPAYAVAIERATGGQVTRQDLRPHDWHLIWPELLPPPPPCPPCSGEGFTDEKEAGHG